jgi:mRNA interferase MazF
MIKSGDVVWADFAGAMGVKRRPTVVISSDLYHLHRPDIVLGVLTTNIAAATGPTDYVLQDWASAGLRSQSAFRSYFSMALPKSVRKVGELSAPDLQQVLNRVHLAFAT